MATHASNPVADHVAGDVYRIYFSTRDAENRSSIGWIEIDLAEPTRVLRMSGTAVLRPGPRGSFDDSGCSAGSIVRGEGPRRLLYYMGWNLGVGVPWRNAIGLAVSDDCGDTFARACDGPLMDRSCADPYTLSYPWVLRDAAGWRMWYGSHLGWGDGSRDMSHMIKHASSADGHAWQRDGRVVIAPASADEYAFARPCVLQRAGRLGMWFAYRGESYRIGYAESADGTRWERDDAAAGLAPTPGAWDGESVEYPCVFAHGSELYMLYCGDGYGRTGFGIARACMD